MPKSVWTHKVVEADHKRNPLISDHRIHLLARQRWAVLSCRYQSVTE